MINLNVRGFKTILENLKDFNDCDIVCCSETWLEKEWNHPQSDDLYLVGSVGQKACCGLIVFARKSEFKFEVLSITVWWLIFNVPSEADVYINFCVF